MHNCQHNYAFIQNLHFFLQISIVSKSNRNRWLRNLRGNERSKGWVTRLGIKLTSLFKMDIDLILI
jgi:hypothetical protein